MKAHVPADLRIWRLLITVTVVAALYFLRDLVLPVAVAALVTFVLSPLVSRIERYVGRVPAVLLVTATTFVLIGLFAWAGAMQMGRLARDLPTYKANLSSKLQALNASGSDRFGRVSRMVEELQAESAERAPATRQAAGERPAAPLAVEVVETPGQSTARLLGTAGSILAPLGFVGAVLILAIFMLVKYDDLRDRIIGLVGRGQLVATTAAMQDASARVYRYLLMSLVVNVTYGIPVGIGLYLIGVPGAMLWAALAIVLRFIPYLGPLIAMAFPILLSLAVFDGWNALLLTVALFVTLEIISNNVIEPWLYGASTGISSFSLILAALAWTWLWGPAGLLLSTPLTVCLLVMGKHVPQMAFLRTVLSDERALDRHELFYQRLLTGDRDAAEKVAFEEIGRSSVGETFQSMMLPALAMVQADLRRGAMDAQQYAAVVLQVHDYVETIAQSAAVESGDEANAPPEAPLRARPTVKIACIAIDSAADGVAAHMFAQLALVRGFEATVLPPTLPVDEVNRTVADLAPDMVWLCAVHPHTLVRCQNLVTALRRRHPAVHLAVGLWEAAPHQGKAIARLAEKGANAISTVFGESLMHLEAFRETFGSEYLPAPIPPDEAARIAALMDTGLAGDSRSDLFDRTTAELARIFDVPIALITVVDTASQHFVSQVGLDADLRRAGQTARGVSVCGHVVAANRPLVVEDLARDPRFAGNPLLREKKLRFYAGVPLRTSLGFVVGSLCILDHVPRQVSERELRLMQMLAENLMCDVEERALAGEARAPAAGTP